MLRVLCVLRVLREGEVADGAAALPPAAQSLPPRLTPY